MKRRDKSAYMIVFIGIFIIALSVGALFQLYSKNSTHIVLGSAALFSRVADSDGKRAKGLGGVERLADHEAMLFVYNKDSKHGIWMKDMKFNIDIIWLDEDKRVVHIVSNASPESYPKSFVPSKPARYVLEVPAGLTAQNNIKIGTKAEFNVNAF